MALVHTRTASRKVYCDLDLQTRLCTLNLNLSRSLRFILIRHITSRQFQSRPEMPQYHNSQNSILK